MNVKELAVWVGILGAVGGGFAGYGKLQAETTQAKTQVKEVREAVKENKEEIDENENINIKQTQVLEYLQENSRRQTIILDKLEKKL